MNGVHKVNVVHPVTTGRRAQRREARREAVLDVAMALVTEGGLEAITTHRIAAELDCAVGALYRYFSSKDGILAALQCRALARLHASLEQRYDACGALAKANAKAGALARILSGAEVYQQLVVTAPETFQLLCLVLGDPRPVLDDGDAAQVVVAADPLFSSVAQLFEDAVKLGALADGAPKERAVVYWSALQGVLQLGKLARFDAENLNPHRLAPLMTRTLLLGWGAESNALNEAQAWLSMQQKGQHQRTT